MTAPASPASRGGLLRIVAACCVIGAITVGTTLAITRARTTATRAASAMAPEEYGRLLLTETSVLLGPDQPDAAMRYSGSRLQCESCHLKAGTEPGTLALLQTYGNYPRVSGRDGGLRDIKARINGCMTRSMNGRALPVDSPEMTAMASYIRALGEEYAATSVSHRAAHDPKDFVTPDRAADPMAGKRVFDARCAVCHGANGQGLRATVRPIDGYRFPPLWGPDSFNDGAGTHRVLTAAKFIKTRMPRGKADLSDDDAFDVAAYINVQPRPLMANLDRDYPDRATKPVDNPYGPYADPFSIEQHRLGPFKPIEAFYAKLKASK